MTYTITAETVTTATGSFKRTNITWNGFTASVNERGLVYWSDGWETIRELVDAGVLKTRFTTGCYGHTDFVLA
jgi:hypothetical protein